MGLLDSITSGVARNLQSSVQGSVNRAVSSAASNASRSAQNKITTAAKNASINPDDAIKKIMFSKNSSGGYDLSYEGKPLNTITANDLKMVQGRTRAQGLPVMKMFLRSRHEVFKHEKVSTTIAERILDDMGIKA